MIATNPAIPADVRARILRAIGTKPPPAPKQQPPPIPPGRRVATAALVARLDAHDPAVADVARRILATPVPTTATTRTEAMAEMVRTLTALRLQNVRREIDHLGDYLRDNPGHLPSQARVAALLGYVRDVERERKGARRA